MKPAAVVALVLGLLGAAVCVGVGLHEYAYYRDHPFRTGVSGVLVWLAAGGALGCLAAAASAWSRRWAGGLPVLTGDARATWPPRAAVPNRLRPDAYSKRQIDVSFAHEQARRRRREQRSAGHRLRAGVDG